MDMISGLPDECLVKILSFLYTTQDVVSTSILSKRWECVWMGLPKLVFYRSKYTESERESLQRFLDRRLPLHKAPVFESLRFKLSYPDFKPQDIKLWIAIAASRCIRELDISYSSYPENPLILPSSLYTNKSLVVLKLYGEILLEDVPRNVCLPYLKTLELHSVKYAGEESLQRLLSICPVLEDLELGLRVTNNKFILNVPFLKRLTLYIYYQTNNSDVAGIVINTPSLEYFKLRDHSYKRDYYMIEYMPKLVEADIDVSFPDLNCLISTITSVKRLTLCHCLGSLHTEVAFGDGFVFNQLEHLNLCVCSWHKSNLLSPLLKDSPNLRTLRFFKGHDAGCITCWNEATMVPECSLSSLQTFIWPWYSGTPKERDLAVYILETASCLKTVRISSRGDEVTKLKMLKELALSSRASKTCQLVFG